MSHRTETAFHRFTHHLWKRRKEKHRNIHSNEFIVMKSALLLILTMRRYHDSTCPTELSRSVSLQASRRFCRQGTRASYISRYCRHVDPRTIYSNVISRTEGREEDRKKGYSWEKSKTETTVVWIKANSPSLTGSLIFVAFNWTLNITET